MHIVQRKYSPSTALALSRNGATPLLSRVWAARGIKSISDVKGKVTDLIPYEELTNAVEMAEILADAIVARKKLLIIADYDADGATACTVGLRALKAYGADVESLIPDRMEHGYGLTDGIVDMAANLPRKPDIIITVDNGISNVAGVKHAMKLGMQVLITDHHLPGDEVPPALKIVNPNQRGCDFPAKSLAGCGVIWYVMWALKDVLARRGIPQADPTFKIASLLPIVAVGTIADVVALERNNRILVAEGLRFIHNGVSFAGIDALAKVAGKDARSLSCSDVGFGIGPHINAAGRLASMDAGVACLMTDSAQAAEVWAKELHEKNMERRLIEAKIVDEAVQQLLTLVQPDTYTAVLHADEWHHGVIGIAASRVKDRIYRPTFVMASGKHGEIKGSGRSIIGFHLRDALDMVHKRNPGLLPKFGGHAMAAGVTVCPGGLERFREAFEEVAHELLSPSLLNQQMETDGSLEAMEMNLTTVAQIKAHVWGQGFQEPTFADDFKVLSAKKAGKDEMTLKLKVERGGVAFDAIKFRHEGLNIPERVRMVYKLDANTFSPFGRPKEPELQLLVDHVEPV